MVTAQIFNQQAQKRTPTVWGCSTTAGEWKFLKLVNKNLFINKDSFYINELAVLIGAFKNMFEQIDTATTLHSNQ